MTREAFLTLSLGLAFDVSFVQDYLKRVLRERELDIWDSKEALVFVLLQQPNLPNPYADYRKLLDTYNNLTPLAVQSNTEQQQTQEINGVAERMVYFLSCFRSVPLHSPEMETLLAQHKYLVEHRNERADSHEHLHTPDRLFCEMRDSVGEKLKKIELPAASAYTTGATIQKGTLGTRLYGFPYKKEQLFDQEHPVSHEELIKFVRLLAPILEGKWLDSSRMTFISQGTRHVRRDELMTMAFLDRAMELEADIKKHPDLLLAQLNGEDLSVALDSFCDYMNEILHKAGFDELYCGNPYDVLLMYLSVLDTPFCSYSYIFSIFMDIKKEITS